MPEVSRYETLAQANPVDHMSVQRKSSNMSTNSDDSLRKISNDSGIGIGAGGPTRLPNRYDELVGEPRLSTDISAAMLLAHQQSLSAAAALNPTMLSLMSAGLGGLFANPLATAMLQQEATARKLLETTSSGGKAPNAAGAAGKAYTKDQLSMYPGLAGLMQPSNTSQVPDQLALSEALRGQLLNRKLSEEVNGNGVVKPTRKANSFSGTPSPLHRQFSPPTSNAASPNLNHSLSPNNRNAMSNSGDEQQPSPYRDDESIGSGKSSNRSRTPQPGSQPTDGQLNAASTYNPTADIGFPGAPVLNAQQFHPSSRKRKNGIIAGSMPVPDLSSYAPLAHPAFPSQPAANDLPMHKLSTGSLPATLPSAHMPSLVQEPLSSRGSPATSRKRQRNMQNDEKDESYWERRRKNNEAAKRSRDSRRAKEDEIAIRAAFLEQENFKLRLELNKLKEEYAKIQTELENYRKPNKDTAINGQTSNSDSPANEQSKTNESPPTNNEPTSKADTMASNASSQTEPTGSESGESLDSNAATTVADRSTS